MKKKILVMVNHDPNVSPRPHRMAGWLKDKYAVTVLARQPLQMEGLAQTLTMDARGLFGVSSKNASSLQKVKALFVRLQMFFQKNYEGLVWSSLGEPHEILSQLRAQGFDFIISHDCTLLPLAFAIKADSRAKVLLDAREYYPRNFEDQPLWRLFIQPVNKYLCKTYLPRCDHLFTVSAGLAREYEREYGVSPQVLMSLPAAQPMQPQPVCTEKIRIIHHGSASPSRKIEQMIAIMPYLDERFTLDLMLVGGGAYDKKLRRMAAAAPRARMIPPVPMPQITTFLNQYDIGLFLVPPSNFNLKYTLPNKLFEFIQARLMVAIGPSVEMQKLVQQYDCGVVAADFSPQALAQKLNSLAPQEILRYKQNAHLAAAELNAEANRRMVLQVIQSLEEEL